MRSEIIKNLIRLGTVDSVDVEKRTARVRFEDKGNLVSGELKVLQNQPLIIVEKEIDGSKWESSASYATVDHGISSINYTKELPDKVELTKVITYLTESKTHKHKITIYPWLPYIGQMVICIYLPMDNGDGFVIGGI